VVVVVEVVFYFWKNS